MKILVCNPAFYKNTIYMPYTWARFKTYIDLDYSHIIPNIEWLTPIYDNTIEMPNDNIDVLVLSNYIWNYEKNYEFAREVKKKNPNCFIIAGGPQVSINDNTVFDNTVVDAICYTEGEHVFAELLYKMSMNADIDIPGIILRSNRTKERLRVPKLELDTLHSPWLHCEAELLSILKRETQAGKRVNILFETNRGCPYSCAFCDWGMATNSKIKRFNKNMIMKEIDLIMSWMPNFIMIADANYGMFKEDLDYIKRFTDNKFKYSESKTGLTFCPAKNNKKYVTQSHKLLKDADMLLGAMQIGFQHTDPDVLTIMNRGNIRTEYSLEEIKESYKLDIPMIGVLIIGNPGDTLSKWKHTMCDMLRMQFHEDIKVHDFHLLPNAPASHPEYIEKYKLEYIEKYYNESASVANTVTYKAKFICESFSFDRKDYVDMLQYSSFLQAAHIYSVFKFMSIFAYNTCNISYEDFYDHIINLPTIKEILVPVKQQLNDYVFHDYPDKFILYETIQMNLENYIYLKMLDNLDNIYNEFSLDLGEYTDSIIEFQKFVLLKYNTSKTVCNLEYDYRTYFNEAMSVPANEIYAGKPKKINTLYNINHKVGIFGEIDTSNISNYSDMYDAVLRQPANFRHKLTYYPSVFFN